MPKELIQGSCLNIQVIESVQLLSMTEPKDDRGYYALKGQFRFASFRQGSLECPDQAAHHQMAADVAAQAKDENRSKMSKLLLAYNLTEV